MINYSSKVRELTDDGFTVIKNPFTSQELYEVNLFFSKNEEHFNAQDPYSNFGLRHNVRDGILFDIYQRYPVFRAFASCKEIQQVLKPIIGEHIFLYENSLVYSPELESTEVPWHQDFQNRPDEPIKYIAFIALDHLGIDSGALRVIKKSHKGGFIPFRTRKGQGHHTGVPEKLYESLDLSNKQTIEQFPGDILIFNQLLVHSIPPWRSKSLGRGIRFSYQGFDQMYTPRLSPITIFGGSPCDFEQEFQASPKIISTQKSLVIRLKKKIKSIFAWG